MHDNKTRILKEAVLLELRGNAFYTKLAETAPDREVGTFFRMMAAEEEAHARLLMEELAGNPKKADSAGPLFSTADAVLPPDALASLNPAGFEAAAISAAIDLETRSIELYTRQAEAAGGEPERTLYRRLTAWEEEHREKLLQIDRALQERFHIDNNFQPY